MPAPPVDDPHARCLCDLWPPAPHCPTHPNRTEEHTMDHIPIDKPNLEAYIIDNPPAFGIRVRQGPLVVLTPEDGREVRDALTDWLDELEADDE